MGNPFPFFPSIFSLPVFSLSPCLCHISFRELFGLFFFFSSSLSSSFIFNLFHTWCEKWSGGGQKCRNLKGWGCGGGVGRGACKRKKGREDGRMEGGEVGRRTPCWIASGLFALQREFIPSAGLYRGNGSNAALPTINIFVIFLHPFACGGQNLRERKEWQLLRDKHYSPSLNWAIILAERKHTIMHVFLNKIS